MVPDFRYRYQRFTSFSRHPTIVNLNLCCQRSIASPRDWVPQPVSHSLSAPSQQGLPMNEKIYNKLLFGETVKTEAANITKLQTKKDSILPSWDWVYYSWKWNMNVVWRLNIPGACCAFPCSVTGNLKVSAPYDLAFSTPDPTAYICPVLWVDRWPCRYPQKAKTWHSNLRSIFWRQATYQLIPNKREV